MTKRATLYHRVQAREGGLHNLAAGKPKTAMREDGPYPRYGTGAKMVGCVRETLTLNVCHRYTGSWYVHPGPIVSPLCCCTKRIAILDGPGSWRP